MESNFEITEYMEEGEGFQCSFKERYEDFVVHEIDPLGNVVRLTQMVPPSPEACEFDLHDVFDEQVAEELVKLKEGELDQVAIDCQEKSKVERTKMHNCIRQWGDNELDSRTMVEGERVKIVVQRLKDKRGERKRKFWPHHEKGDFCRFVLYKENMDSFAAVGEISKKLGLKRHGAISIAGNKDRRGVTSQLASVYRIEASRLLSLNSHMRRVKVGNCEYRKESVYLGNLSGNLFTIVLRNVQCSDDQVLRCVERLKNRGFINYYGTQRFGTTDIPTHQVGKCILLKQWEAAVDLILMPRNDGHDNDDLEPARLLWQKDKDATASFEAIPSRLKFVSIEATLLKGIIKFNDQYEKALQTMGRNMLNLYLHSYQSLLWNRLASRRIRQFGVHVMSGTNDTTVADEEGLSDYSCFQVTLPLFSANAQLPKNQCAQLYEQILDEEGITLQTFAALDKQYALHGGMRRMFVQPKQLSAQLTHYRENNARLLRTDMDDILEQRKLESPVGDGRKAVVVEFSLPSGCYATMALREMCRMDMSKKGQTIKRVDQEENSA